MLTWTRITDCEVAAQLLPAWFRSRMIGLRGKFGLLLTSGDVLKITSITALHQSSCGTSCLMCCLITRGFPMRSIWRGSRSIISARQYPARQWRQLISRMSSEPLSLLPKRRPNSRPMIYRLPGMKLNRR